MTIYAVRRASSSERSRWVIHRHGYPLDIVGDALTRWGATRIAQRWMRQDQRAQTSYPVHRLVDPKAR
jgi:hypothetical protein